MSISSFWGQIKDYDKREVVFLAPPFCPHNYMDSNSEVDQALEQMMTEFPEENFIKRRFFPFLSDSSYLAMRETTEDINKLKANFP